MSRTALAPMRTPAPPLSRPRQKRAPTNPSWLTPPLRTDRYAIGDIPLMAPEAGPHASDADDSVERIELPFRKELEERFQHGLDALVVVTGDRVADSLLESQADGAAVGNVIYLRDHAPSIETVTHEVVHALQANGGPGPGPLRFGRVNRTDPAEAEADALAADMGEGEVRESLPLGTIAFRRANIPATPPPTKPTEKDTLTRELEKGQPADAPQREPQTAAAQAAPPETTEEAPTPLASALPADTPAPTFELPEAPETALTPEELAARQAELEAAQTAIAQATDAQGVVGAYADAPPTVKAATQSTIGARIQHVIAADEQKFDENLPDFHAELKAGEAPEPRGEVSAPAPREVVLEAEIPPPAPEPDLPPLPKPPRYEENDEVISFLRRLFGGGAAAAIARALGMITTTDPDVDTDLGGRPKVPLEGDTDPSRARDQQRAGVAEGREQRLAATQLVVDGRGPEQVQLHAMDELVPVGELEQSQPQGLSGSPDAERLNQMALPEEVLAQFDQDLGPTMQASLQEARDQVAAAERDRDQQRDEALATAERDRDRLTREADDQQRAEVLAGRESIQSLRQTTIDAQEAAVVQLESDAELARSDTESQIQTRVDADEGEISGRYEAAESQAREQVAQGGRDAEAKRAEAEKEAEDESWFDSAIDFVADVFDAITSFINDIFDKIRSAVNGLFDAVRDFAKGLIDLAAAFVKGAITAFGEGLKFLVNHTVGEVFPELAAELNAGIDGAVATANEAVDAVANKLKAGIDAVVDTLKKAVNFVINTFQAAVNTGLAFMEATITGDWAKAARKILESVLRVLGIEPAEFYAFIAPIVETVELIIDDPIGFLGHVVDAVVLGFQKFADHFLTHLKAGIIKWLTGALGDIQIPAEFDLVGVLDLARQIAGLTWEWVRAKAVRLVGEKNVARLEFLFSYVQTLIDGGFPALWERIAGDLTGLADMVIGGIKDHLVDNVILAGIKWIGALFTPVGALVKLVFTIWNLFTFVRDQFSRIVQILQTVVSTLANIARGIIEPAALGIEAALANLLPVALDLVARLLDLGNIAARAREIIGGVRDWVDQAVDKLLDRVLRTFTSTGEPLVATAGEVPVGSTVGSRLTVDVTDGPDHVLTIQVSGSDSTAVLASDPLPVSRWLDNFTSQLPEIEDKAEREAAAETITTARTRLGTLDTEADTLVAAQAGGGTPPPDADAEVRTDEELLRDALAAVFKAFGKKGPVILDLFAAEIEAAHELARPQIRKALKEHETDFQTMKWPEVRAEIAKTYNPFVKPLLSSHVFGERAQATAALKVASIVATLPNGRPLTGDEVKSFLGDWLSRLVNTSTDEPFPAAKAALQTVLFENGALDKTPAFDQAISSALGQYLGRGDQADPALVKAGTGRIIELLVDVATGKSASGGLDLTRWDSDTWGPDSNPRKANREWIHDRFRGPGGKHEWIPTNYLGQVLERARTSEVSGDEATAARWVKFQDEFRSPTNILFYPAADRYLRTAPYTRDPVSHTQKSGTPLTVLQGHVGAVYAPISDIGDYRDEVVQQTQGQGPWHDDLRQIFDNNPGADVSTMKTIIQQMDSFIQQQLWQGEQLPKPGFNEYYKAARKQADTSDTVPFGTLERMATKAVTEIRNDFARARKAVEL
jgi:hypothetical protein